MPSITGVVSTELGSPLAGAEVVVRDARATVVARLTTGDTGRFSILSLPSGIYRVNVSLRDFVSANVTVNVTGGPSVPLTVKLMPAVESIPVVAQTEVLTTGNSLASDEGMASRELDQVVPGTGFQSAVRMFASLMATNSAINIKGGRPDQVGVQLETGSLVDPASAIAHVPLPDDAIRSITVLPNP